MDSSMQHHKSKELELEGVNCNYGTQQCKCVMFVFVKIIKMRWEGDINNHKRLCWQGWNDDKMELAKRKTHSLGQATLEVVG